MMYMNGDLACKYLMDAGVSGAQFSINMNGTGYAELWDEDERLIWATKEFPLIKNDTFTVRVRHAYTSK